MKTSWWIVLNRGLADPNPGAYWAPFRKSGTTGGVQGPDWGCSGSGKRGFRGVVSEGDLRWGAGGIPAPGFGVSGPGKFLENFSAGETISGKNSVRAR